MVRTGLQKDGHEALCGCGYDHSPALVTLGIGSIVRPGRNPVISELLISRGERIEAGRWWRDR